MKLTNRTKEAFEKWFAQNNQFNRKENYKWFRFMPSSMKYGVYIDFFNTKKYNGEPLFDYVFGKYYSIKLGSQTHNDIVILSIESASIVFNESEVDW